MGTLFNLAALPIVCRTPISPSRQARARPVVAAVEILEGAHA
jgi:hypothetical protein